MIKNYGINNFFREISLKKQYIKNLRNQTLLLASVKEKDYRMLHSLLFRNNRLTDFDNLITYIIDISYFRTNTLLHVMDSSGHLKFFCSAGYLKYRGKGKKARFMVFKDIYNILLNKLKFLKGKPVALHLKNVGLNKFWITRKLKKKFFIKVIKSFDLYSYNGCRKKKIRRKKFKKKR